MRTRRSNKGLSVNAVAGSYVVILGLSITGAMRKGLRGFAIKRTDDEAQESYWMTGTKVFESIEPHPEQGEKFSSLIHPFQSFQWSDYSAKPGQSYTYTVAAMYGSPGALEQRVAVDVSVTTEAIEGEKHTIHFNRGSPASQEYARRFLNKPPSEAGPGAYEWLSRGLLEGIIAFIQRAKGKRFGLKGAFYEFQWPAVLDELREAKKRKVDVDVVFDGPEFTVSTTNFTADVAASREHLTFRTQDWQFGKRWIVDVNCRRTSSGMELDAALTLLLPFDERSPPRRAPRH